MITNLWIIVATAVLIMFFAVAGLYVRYSKWRQIDYRTLFILGMIWVPLGISINNDYFWIFGVILMAIGLGHADSWHAQRRFDEMDYDQKILMLILLTILGLMFLVGVTLFFASKVSQFANTLPT